MGDMGLAGMGGAAGAGDALQTLFQERMQAAAAQRAQQQLEQNDALMRMKAQEHADEVAQNLEFKRQAEKDRTDAAKASQQTRLDKQASDTFTMNPVGADLPAPIAGRAQQLGFPVQQIAGPKVQQTSGFMPLPSAPSQGPGMQPIGGLTPIQGPQAPAGASTTTTDTQSLLNAPDTFKRGATQADVITQQNAAEKVEAARLAAENRTNDNEQKAKDRLAQIAAAAAAKPVSEAGWTIQQGMVGGKPGWVRINSHTGEVKPVEPGEVTPKPSAADAAHDKTNTEALDTLKQLDQAIENAKDLIGPGAGRVSSLEQMAGSADPRIQALGVKMKAAKMRVDHAVTGSVRAGASPMMMQQWDNILANKVTPEGLKSGVQAMREILGGGAASAGGSGIKSITEIK